MILKTSISSLKILLILVFVAGLATMCLEFSISRLLVPIFGDSIYTWGILIGVVLVGLSVGYQLGGQIADKLPTFEKFGSILFSAGLYILFIPFISPLIVDFSTEITGIYLENINQNYANNLNSLLSTFSLIIFPTLLLGMISPYAIKLAAKSMDNLGNISGNLYSVATIGSIVGTFLTVFVLIPFIEINDILYGLGALLLLSSLFYLRKIAKVLILILTVIVLVSVLFDNFPLFSLDFRSLHFHLGTLVYQTETLYSHLDVIDNYNSPNNRALFLNGFPHSIMDKSDPNSLVSDYTRFFPIGLLLNDNATNILFIGGGGFSGPKYFLDKYPNLSVDVVEIDPKVVDVAREYFFLNDSNPKLNIYTQDARDYLEHYHGKYDVIILDAFSKTYVPFHLMTLEFYDLLYTKLSDDGLVVANHIGSPDEDKPESDLYRANLKTFLEVFPKVFVFMTDYSQDIQNLILTSVKTLPISSTNKTDDNTLSELQKSKPYILQEVNYSDYLLKTDNLRLSDVPILTDQYAPVESLLDPMSGNYYDRDVQNNSQVGPLGESGPDQYTSIPFSTLSMLIIALFWITLQKPIWTCKK